MEGLRRLRAQVVVMFVPPVLVSMVLDGPGADGL